MRRKPQGLCMWAALAPVGSVLSGKVLKWSLHLILDFTKPYES